MPGSIGETSFIAVAIGGVWLLLMRIAAWRIVVGGFAGVIIFSLLLNWAGSDSNPMFAIPWHWHIVMGGFAFGIFFMATDPRFCYHDQYRQIFLRFAHWLDDGIDSGYQSSVS